MKYKPLTVDLKYENLVEFSHFEKRGHKNSVLLGLFLRFIRAGLSASTAFYSFVKLRPGALAYQFLLHDGCIYLDARSLAFAELRGGISLVFTVGKQTAF
jgi:hypothetical protein